MSIDERLWDDEALLPASPDGPHLVGVLLRQLGVARSLRQEKVVAIEGWLKDHTPSRSLQKTIRDAGLGEALTSRRP